MFCNIDHKNILTSITIEEMLNLDKQIASLSNPTKPFDSPSHSYSNHIILKNEDSTFSSSLSFYKAHSARQQPIKKIQLKESITFLESSLSFQGNLFSFTQENTEFLGKVLLYSYKKLIKNSQIKSMSSFTSACELILTAKINLKQKHKEYVKKHGNISLVSFFQIFRNDKDNKKYLLPPEMIYIMNIMKKISKLKFELNNFDQMTFDMFHMIMLNVKWIFFKLEEIDIVLTNDSLLKALHSRYGKELIIEEIKHSKTIKRVNYDRGIVFKRLQYDYSPNYINVNNEQYYDNIDINKSTSFTISRINTQSNYNDSSPLGSILLLSDGMVNNNANSNTLHYSDILNYYSFSFEYILILSHFISKWYWLSTVSLSFSEEFQKEIQKSIDKKHQIDLRNYRFFTNLFKLDKLKELNIEFNSLDFNIFERLLHLLGISKVLHTLRISFFLSEAHYYPAAIFKLYQSLEAADKIMAKSDSLLNRKPSENDDIDYMIVDHLSSKFNKNMQLLFWELKWLMLDQLCIIIQSPDIINSNEKYSMIILKFILNIFLSLNSLESQYKTVKIIAPFIQMDNRRLIDIEDFYEMLDLPLNNCNLRHLSLQMQFYDLVNVGHLLTLRLQSVYIGDFNPKSLQYFTEALSEPKFRKNCKLQIISIGILPIVKKFSTVEKELVMICNIMMPLLSSVEIRSSLNINEQEYKRFICNIDCSFVKNFIFEFDIKSKREMSINRSIEVIHYYDYFSQTEIYYCIVKQHSELLKRILRFLVIRKEAMLTVVYK